MKKEIRTVVYDEELHIEAYRFQGFMRPFPNHFHEYYVIGLMEEGERCLSCKNKEYTVCRGDILLFNPGDSHSCVQSDGGAMDYLSISISKETMLELVKEVTGEGNLPGFSMSVIHDGEAACYLRALHEMVLSGSKEFGKEENLILLLTRLIQRFGQPFEECAMPCDREIEAACVFMEEHYAEHICLDQICRKVGLSKSTLLRSFTRSRGVTPYCYLENIRIGKAKKLLEQGVSPLEAAMRTGFSDQSHFTNYFTRFIGLAPGVYQSIFTKKNRM